MSKIILWLVSLIPKGKFKTVTYWKHSEDRYLYLCMSEKHILNEKTFLEVFEYAIRISQFEFDCILYFNEGIEIIHVADDNIHALIEEKNNINEFLSQLPDTGHEESEDKNISND